jgi:hypothetical protein
MKEYRDALGRLNLRLGEDGSMFPAYAFRLEVRCGGKRVQQLNGPAQRYWDYEVKGTIVVLHADAFAGILLYVEDGTHEELLRRIAAQLVEPDAASRDAQP